MFARIPDSTDRPSSRTDAARRPKARGSRQRLGSFLSSGLVIVLVLFHGHLLWQRITSFSLFEPWVALRWAAAALLLAGFVLLQRAGISVIWGHKAQVLWLLVLLLHAGAMAPAESHQPMAEPGLLLALSLWGFALRAILGELDRRAGGSLPVFARVFPASRASGLGNGLGYLEPLCPRPPPAV